MLAPISWRVPPRHYGPWEQFVSLLTEGLVRRGVDVTLFATADSLTAARLAGTAPTGYSEDPRVDAKVWEGLHISAAFERAAEFDVIHNSFDFLPLTYSGLVDTPVVTTIHGFSSARDRAGLPEVQREAGTTWRSATPTDTKASTMSRRFTTASTWRTFELGQGPGDYLLFFGRIHPEKGTAEAIDVAESAELPLMLAGIIQDQEYFEQFVEPRLDGERVRYLGPGRARRSRRPARRGTGTPSPHQLRGAFRLQRRRSDGLRNARDRTSAWIDAGDRPRRCERFPGRFTRRSGRRGPRLNRLGQEGGASVGRAPLRLRPHGRRLSRRLSPGRRAPSRAPRRPPQCPLTRDPRESVFGWASTTGRLGRRWAGGRTSTTRKSQPISRGSPRAVSTRSGSS